MAGIWALATLLCAMQAQAEVESEERVDYRREGAGEDGQERVLRWSRLFSDDACGSTIFLIPVFWAHAWLPLPRSCR